MSCDWEKIISDVSQELGNIDAALPGAEKRQGKLYFFHKDIYLRYDVSSYNIDSNYPRTINPTWSFPDYFSSDIDAAVLASGKRDGKAYFFKNNQYLRYDFNKLCVDSGYPMDLHSKNAFGLPETFAPMGLDAAFRGAGVREGKAYFMANGEYVR